MNMRMNFFKTFMEPHYVRIPAIVTGISGIVTADSVLS